MRAATLLGMVLCAIFPGHSAFSPLRPSISMARLAPLSSSYLDSLSPPPVSNADETDVGVESSQRTFSSPLARRAYSLYKFTRPHTIRGTVLASVAGTARALLDSPGTPFNFGLLLPRAFIGMLALLLGNCYIVGINQIYDLKIDRINKPYLPVASGEMSVGNAWYTVALSGILGPLIVAKFFSPLLLKLYMLGWLLGGIYSVPPARTKRNPLMAAATISLVRGFLLNFGVYHAVKEAIGHSFKWNPKVAFMARFMTVFAAVIAVTKDLPDVEGDVKAGISTFASERGVAKVAKYGAFALGLNYAGAIITALVAPRGTFNKAAMVLGHAALGGWLLKKWRGGNVDDAQGVKRFYKGVWDLFYAEYALYTLI
mmetsp:Transcript_11849/g.23979  ORF Transcript_11849/g.23979 Transcript_11849/m.23979 type:complete len:371 (+) Transcript_11849:44-1156(+)